MTVMPDNSTPHRGQSTRRGSYRASFQRWRKNCAPVAVPGYRYPMLTVADTAFATAAVRAEEALRPPDERLFEDPYAGLFWAAGSHAEEGTQRFLSLPFFRDGIRLRTRFIDD